MFIRDYGAFIAAIVSPIAAVLITVWYQNREARRKAQMALFLDLVSFRDYIPLPWQYTIALNRIDVIFHKQNVIRQLWHEYYDLIGEEQKGQIVERVKEKKDCVDFSDGKTSWLQEYRSDISSALLSDCRPCK